MILAALALQMARPVRAEAQEVSVFAPYLAVTTGGDTKKSGTTVGFSTAYIEESGWGGELDVAYVTDFNDVDYHSTAIATVMVNLLVAPRVTRMIRPFGVVGLGLIRARGCGGPNCTTEFSRTDLGLNGGAGAYIHFNDIWGVRGDVRYFRYAQIHQDLPRKDNGQFDFWRIGAAGVITW